MKERLQKIIARSGIVSRRKAEEYIRLGRVMVNGKVVTQLGSLADAVHDQVSVDEVELTGPENKVYVLLHKPAGYMSSLHDPEGRKTIDLLYKDIAERLYPVGRLDYDTEGLLVITNDGMFSQLLQHPRYGIEKKYLVKVRGVPREDALKRLRDGVVIDGQTTSRSGVRLVKKALKTSWCEVVLHEGLNRQLKKMFELIGHPTMRIIRTEIGPLQLGRLPVGSYRFLAKSEIEAVKECGAQRPAASGRSGSGSTRTQSPSKPRTGSKTKRTFVSSKPGTNSTPKRSPSAAKPRIGSNAKRTFESPKPRTDSKAKRTSASTKSRSSSKSKRISASTKPRSGSKSKGTFESSKPRSSSKSTRTFESSKPRSSSKPKRTASSKPRSGSSRRPKK